MCVVLTESDWRQSVRLLSVQHKELDYLLLHYMRQLNPDLLFLIICCLLVSRSLCLNLMGVLKKIYHKTINKHLLLYLMSHGDCSPIVEYFSSYSSVVLYSRVNDIIIMNNTRKLNENQMSV